ncbi:MAG TPA: carboxypeptidase-like regulatory domain-containing protein [Thermoanaerobaculia bacterium]|nr:carboxypeptidase-like regulatory domain-containing protein [Thermoanaerobaculia bacterium]
MKRHRIVLVLSALWLALAAGTAFAGPPAPPISGVVRHAQTPLSGVLVIFVNVGDNSLTRLHTASDGTFVLASAAPGVYDLVAYKRGFEPALQRLWHQAGAAAGVSSVSIALTPKGKSEPQAPEPQTIWDMRERLPTDVLREIALEEIADKSTTPTQRIALNKLIAGELTTVTEAPAQSANAPLSRAALGLHGGLPNGWSYGISGDYARLGNGDTPGDVTTGNAAGVALDVAPSADEHLQVSTRRNSLSFADSPASLQTHAVNWSRGVEQGSVESVGARYIEETNLYRATSLGTTIFPISSRTWEVNAEYGRPASLDTPGVSVGMVYRHWEASVGPSGVGADGVLVQAAPDADLAASASFKATDKLEVDGGVVARYLGAAPGAYGIAPVATVRYGVGGGTIYARGLYRALGSTSQATAVMPRIASIEESLDPAATRALAVGFQRKVGADSQVDVEVSEAKMGELVRAFFQGDFLTDFDSVYLLDGNSVKQLKASVTQRLSNTVSGNISVRYGTIDGNVASPSAESYGMTSNAGRFWAARASVEVLPTKTGIALLVRGIRQDLQTAASLISNDSDKLALSVSQDLSVIGITPFGAGWKLIVAVENAKGTALTEHKDEPVTANRLLGGVAVSF